MFRQCIRGLAPVAVFAVSAQAHADLPIPFAPAGVYQPGVSLYGIIDTGFAVEPAKNPNGSGNVTQVKLASGQMTGSTWGFAGNEDLGGGYHAVFVLEGGFSSVNGALGQSGNFFGRQAYVGVLNEKYGVLGMGRMYSPTWRIQNMLDFYRAGLNGSAGQMMTALARINNAVTFSSATFAGLSFTAQYAFGNTGVNTTNGQKYGTAVRWDNGPVHLGASYEYFSTGSSPFTFGGGEAGGPSLYAFKTVPANTTVNWFEVGGIYDFDLVRIALAYSTQIGIPINNPSTGYTTTLGPKSNLKLYQLSFSVPLGPSEIIGSAMYNREGAEVLGEHPSARAISLAYKYDISKRTLGYISYGKIFNRGGSLFTILSATDPGVLDAEGNSSSLMIGIRHMF